MIGSGGREAALAWKLSTSPLCSDIFVYPGSVASQVHAKPLSMNPLCAHPLTHPEHMEKLAEQAQDMDLVVCGPEAPLCAGLYDVFVAHGIALFGPPPQAAQLESSKAFAKRIMKKAQIPTATYVLASSQKECGSKARDVLAREGRVVLKADGLAAGKGVFICTNDQDISQAIDRLYGTMRHACTQVVVESFLQGRECSYFAWVHKDDVKFLGFARDYKRLQEGDKGPNTGGMGCYAPVPWLPSDSHRRVREAIVSPLLKALSAEGTFYSGFLYVGMMWSEAGPQVLEFNVRLGDPECQALCVSDSRDWLAVICDLMDERKSETTGETKSEKKEKGEKKEKKEKKMVSFDGDELRGSVPLRPTVCLVMTSSCYPYGENPLPGSFVQKDLLQVSTVSATNPIVFGASLKDHPYGLETGKGRVLSVVARGNHFQEARDLVCHKAQEIHKNWPSGRWRNDLAVEVL